MYITLLLFSDFLFLISIFQSNSSVSSFLLQNVIFKVLIPPFSSSIRPLASFCYPHYCSSFFYLHISSISVSHPQQHFPIILISAIPFSIPTFLHPNPPFSFSYPIPPSPFFIPIPPPPSLIPILPSLSSIRNLLSPYAHPHSLIPIPPSPFPHLHSPIPIPPSSFLYYYFQLPHSHSLIPIPSSPFPHPHSLIPIPSSPFPHPHSLIPIPSSPFPYSHSLIPITPSPFPHPHFPHPPFPPSPFPPSPFPHLHSPSPFPIPISPSPLPSPHPHSLIPVPHPHSRFHSPLPHSIPPSPIPILIPPTIYFPCPFPHLHSPNPAFPHFHSPSLITLNPNLPSLFSYSHFSIPFFRPHIYPIHLPFCVSHFFILIPPYPISFSNHHFPIIIFISTLPYPFHSPNHHPSFDSRCLLSHSVINSNSTPFHFLDKSSPKHRLIFFNFQHPIFI